MAAVITSLLIGSIESLAAQTVTINASGETVPAGNYYLYSTTDALNLILQLEEAMTSAGVTNPSVWIGQDRKVHITSDTNASFTWTSTTLRNLYGFTGNLGAATSHDAPNISPLLWSPGYRARPTTPLLTEGYDMDDTEITKSQDGTLCVSTTYNTAVLQELSWDSVHIDRIWTTSEAGGEFKRFRDEVLYHIARFIHWDLIVEDDNVTTEIDWGSATAFGPYKLRDPMLNWYERKISNADLYSPVDLEVVKVDEYS